MNILLAVISGILGALAFPYASFWPFAFIFLVPLMVAVSRARSTRDAFLLGGAFGLSYFGLLFAGLSELYLYVSFWAYFAWLSLVVFESLFTCVFVLVFYRLVLRGRDQWLALFLTPSIWVVLEWARSLGEFGVGGGVVGYSLAPVLPIARIASVTGVYGVSFLCVLVNTALFQLMATPSVFVRELKNNLYRIVTVASIVVCVALFGIYSPTWLASSTSSVRPLRVAIIQTNIPQLMKMSPLSKEAILNRHLMMTRDILSASPDLVVWPETFLPTYFMYDRYALNTVKALINGSNSSFIIGAPHFEVDRSYNSAFAFSPSGEVIGRYDKERPVPFGEYLPFRRFFYPLLRGSADLFESYYSSNPDPKLLSVAGRFFGVSICFESTFPSIVRKRALMGADVLLVITNDAWFGHSSLSDEHFEIGVFRAIENGLPLIQAGNTGISGVIDGTGRVLVRTELEREVSFVAEVPAANNPTFYRRSGDVFVYLLIVILALLYAARTIRSRLSRN